MPDPIARFDGFLDAGIDRWIIVIQYILIFLAFFVAGTGALLASSGAGEPTPGLSDQFTVEDIERIVAEHIDTRLREAREAQHRAITEKQLR